MSILWFLTGFSFGVVLMWFTLRHIQGVTRKQLADALRSLASDALQSNNETFLQLAKQALETHLTQARSDLDLRKQAVESLVKPLTEALHEIEREHQRTYGSLSQMAETMTKGQESLARETRNLTQALRSPNVRGRWGELTLRRVAELAGMVEHCDFGEQVALSAGGSDRRPDMVVYLPNKGRIIVDAKTPLDAYLQSVEADSEDGRKEALKRHSRQVKDRVRELAHKSYWAALDYTPQFVVLFLPGEPFLSTALQEDPGLLERAMQDKVVLATPTTLVSLLHAVAHGWRQEQLAENAERIQQLGREMHDRVADWAGHLDDLRIHLSKAVMAFNASIGALEHRVLVSARRFKELGVTSDKAVTEIPQVELTPRVLAASESNTNENPP